MTPLSTDDHGLAASADCARDASRLGQLFTWCGAYVRTSWNKHGSAASITAAHQHRFFEPGEIVVHRYASRKITNTLPRRLSYPDWFASYCCSAQPLELNSCHWFADPRTAAQRQGRVDLVDVTSSVSLEDYGAGGLFGLPASLRVAYSVAAGSGTAGPWWHFRHPQTRALRVAAAKVFIVGATTGGTTDRYQDCRPEFPATANGARGGINSQPRRHPPPYAKIVRIEDGITVFGPYPGCTSRKAHHHRCEDEAHRREQHNCGAPLTGRLPGDDRHRGYFEDNAICRQHMRRYIRRHALSLTDQACAGVGRNRLRYQILKSVGKTITAGSVSLQTQRGRVSSTSRIGSA